MVNKEITIREATHHGNNQLMVGFLAIVSVLAFMGLLAENSLSQRLDDGIIFLLVISAVVWYFWRSHRYQRSFVPLAIMMACFMVKMGAAALVESFSPTDLEDFPVIFALFIGLIISIVVYVRSREGAAARDFKVLTVREAINRANNQLMVGLMALTFLPLFPPAVEKDGLANRIDDTIIMVMAIAGFIWYFSRRNRYHHSLAPLAFVVVSFIAQAGSLFLEISAPSHEGINDIPVFAAFTMGAILSIIIYWRSRQKAALPETSPISQMDSQRQ